MAILPGGFHPSCPEWRSSNECGDRILKAGGKFHGVSRSLSSLEVQEEICPRGASFMGPV